MDTSDIRQIQDKAKINIIKNIIGAIESIGETNYDNLVLQNLSFLDLLLSEIFHQLEYNVIYNGYEGSRIDIKNKTIEILNDCKQSIEIAIEEGEN